MCLTSTYSRYPLASLARSGWPETAYQWAISGAQRSLRSVSFPILLRNVEARSCIERAILAGAVRTDASSVWGVSIVRSSYEDFVSNLVRSRLRCCSTNRSARSWSRYAAMEMAIAMAMETAMAMLTNALSRTRCRPVVTTAIQCNGAATCKRSFPRTWCRPTSSSCRRCRQHPMARSTGPRCRHRREPGWQQNSRPRQ